MKPPLLSCSSQIQKGDLIYLTDHRGSAYLLRANPSHAPSPRISYEFPHGGVGAISLDDALILRPENDSLKILAGKNILAQLHVAQSLRLD